MITLHYNRGLNEPKAGKAFLTFLESPQSVQIPATLRLSNTVTSTASGPLFTILK